MTDQTRKTIVVPESPVALITGGAQGLGEAIARALHAARCRVVLADLQAERAAETARTLDPTGQSAWAMGLDVRQRGQFEKVVETVNRRCGRIDILVNNAGVTIVKPFFEITEEEWEDVLAINLRSAFFGCQLVGPQMRQNGWGRIINITSLAGQLGSRLAGAHYSVSKAGMITLTKVVARELAGAGVTVNAIAPAVVRAPVMSTLPADGLARLIEAIPVGRIGEASEVGALAAYLASADAGYITGATFDINGGQYMR